MFFLFMPLPSGGKTDPEKLALILQANELTALEHQSIRSLLR